MNGKKYVGQTVFTKQIRWKRHVNHANKPKPTANVILHKAIKKYGPYSFTVSVLCETLVSSLSRAEKFFIRFHSSHISLGGYNMTFGGEGSLGRKHTEEAKRKIGEASKGNTYGKLVVRDAEYRRGCGQRMLGNTYASGNKGKTKTETHVKRMSDGVKRFEASLTDEQKEERSEKYKNQPRFTCPHCAAYFFKPPMVRYHGDKCKQRKQAA